MKLLRLAWIGAFSFAAVVFPAVWIAAGTATEAWLVSRAGDKTIGLNQDMFELESPDPKDPGYARKVMEIYGGPTSEPIPVVFVPKDRFLHPKEMPSLTLLLVDKDKGENPLQVQTLRFFAPWVFGGASGTGGALLGVWLWLRFRRRAREKCGA